MAASAWVRGGHGPERHRLQKVRLLHQVLHVHHEYSAPAQVWRHPNLRFKSLHRIVKPSSPPNLTRCLLRLAQSTVVAADCQSTGAAGSLRIALCLPRSQAPGKQPSHVGRMRWQCVFHRLIS